MTPTVKFGSDVDQASFVFRSLFLNLERQARARRGDYEAFPKPWPEILDLCGWN